MIHDKGRLYQMFLYKLLEEQVQDISLLMALLKLYVMLFRKGSGLLQCLHLIPVHACVFLHRVDHGHPGKRLAQIHLYPVVNDLGGSQNFLRHMAVQVLRQVHHAVVIGISLIQLHQGKFRIVSGVQSLVAEDTADLIDPLQSAYDQTFQI